MENLNGKSSRWIREVSGKRYKPNDKKCVGCSCILSVYNPTNTCNICYVKNDYRTIK